MSDVKKIWEKPQIIMEQDLVARAQDPEGDAFLGVLGAPNNATTAAPTPSTR